MATCSQPSCVSEVRAKGLCAKHYTRLVRHGDPETVKRSMSMARLRHLAGLETDDCVEWDGGRDTNGYGRVYVSPGYVPHAHRMALALYEPPPSPEAIALHAPLICHNRACINPRHLRWGTHADNARDRDEDGMTTIDKARYAAIAKALAATHCKRGHEFTPENTRINARGARCCRACARMHSAAHRATFKSET